MLMGNVLDRRQEWVERRRSHVAELRKRSAEAANKLVRLYAGSRTAWSVKALKA